ncbi:MAG TPA: hypothetical protein VFS33_06075, partial [Gemmatimonadales bacterium]|nr:hypothetical protein [Gemmatimonadales bacterium]
IMYAHLAVGFRNGRGLLPRFVALMERLARLPGWFVPASTLLDFLRTRPTWQAEPARRERQRLQWAWLRSTLLERARA